MTVPAAVAVFVVVLLLNVVGAVVGGWPGVACSAVALLLACVLLAVWVRELRR